MVSSSWFRSGLWYGLILACCATFLGCGKPVYCVTSQGLAITQLTDYTAATCSRYERQAAFMINGLGRGDRNLLKGYVVVQKEIYNWEDPYKRPDPTDPTKIMWVGGLTWCPSKYIEIGTGKEAFPHEIVHALENCVGGGGTDVHKGWEESGTYKLIDQAAGL